MGTTLDIVRIPVLNDNYVWLMRQARSGAVGVVDPAVAGPVPAEAAWRGRKITYVLNTHHHGDHVGGKRDRARLPGIDVAVDDGQRFRFGEAEADMLVAPGPRQRSYRLCLPRAEGAVLRRHAVRPWAAAACSRARRSRCGPRSAGCATCPTTCECTARMNTRSPMRALH